MRRVPLNDKLKYKDNFPVTLPSDLRVRVKHANDPLLEAMRISKTANHLSFGNSKGEYLLGGIFAILFALGGFSLVCY